MKHFYTFLILISSTLFGYSQTSLPVNFETETDIFTNFSGNLSYMAIDPVNSSNSVMKTTKTISDETATWAGTTVGYSKWFC